MVIRKLVVLAAAYLMWGCEQRSSINRFSDFISLKIADFQDGRLTDSLYQFLSHEDSRYRAEASLAFGSVQDTAASPVLGNLLLEDSIQQVRINAAFALGQTGGVAAVNALIPALDDPDPSVVLAVLEALGKTVSPDDVEVLKNFQSKDAATDEGLAKAFYRLGLRRMADSSISLHQLAFLGSRSFRTRLASAQFFDRIPATGDKFLKALTRSALHDSAWEVRMASVSALRHFKTDTVLTILGTVLQSEKDYRVRVNAARALRVFPYKQIRQLLAASFRDSSEQVRIAGSEVALLVVRKGDEANFPELQAGTLTARVEANLYATLIIAGINVPGVNAEIRKKFLASADSYQKAALLTALSEDPASYPFIFQELVNSKAFVIKTAAAEGLSSINHRKDFPAKQKTEFADLYKKAIANGDPAVIGIIAAALGDSILGYRTVLKDIGFLNEARKGLHLPKDIESLQPLEDAIAFLEGKAKPPRIRNSFNHPIDWNLVKTIHRDQLVLINTDRGDIKIRLLVDEAPGSVANFVQLINQHYYDGRFVHRMVPNFVMQTGCNRGDGYGSEDYSIRSEFSIRKYTTGSVGYASAGKDTEGTQWFITHSPTPHLDGRYTLFAEVVEGMAVVHRLGVGDKINKVSLIGK